VLKEIIKPRKANLGRHSFSFEYRAKLAPATTARKPDPLFYEGLIGIC
jgi:hypothetical protein